MIMVLSIKTLQPLQRVVTMNTVIIDLEMNPINRKNKAKCKPCSYEIIEIGAVMLDDDNKEIDSFKSYVKPQYSDDVTNKVQDLTGIKTFMLQGAPGFVEVIKLFDTWAGSKGEYRIVTWSESDKNQIEKEAGLKSFYDKEFFERIGNSHDIQIDYTVLAEEERVVSLDKALWSLGILFEGKAHDALFDARNTGTLYTLVTNPSEFTRLFNCVKEKTITDDEESKVTLGSFFDFSKLDYTIA